jgi:hypothetical protein
MQTMRLIPGVLGLLMMATTVVAQAQTPVIGAKYRESVQVAGHTVPLLDGEWTVVGSGSKTFAARSRNTLHVYLAQLAGNQSLSRWVYINTNDGVDPNGWGRMKSVCDRKNVHFAYSDTMNSPKESECWALNHLVMNPGKPASQAGIDFYRWSDHLGRPNTALELVYYFAKHGDYLFVRYCFNPVMAGFPDIRDAVWEGNAWHVDVTSKDPRKVAYLQQLKSIGETLFEKLKTVLR